MKIMWTIALVLCVFILPFTGATAEFDGSKPLLCASVDVMECDAGAECFRATADGIGAPQFYRINFKEKKIIGISQSKNGPPSQIERMESVDGKLILQGAEEAVEGIKDGVGWSLAISKETGRMVLTASGDDVGFVIFGACTPK
jgi:hypothetical protein